MFVTKAFWDALLSERDWLRCEVARLGAEITRLTTVPPLETVAAPAPVALDAPDPLPAPIRDAVASVTRAGTAEHAAVCRWAREQLRNKRAADDVARAILEGDNE